MTKLHLMIALGAATALAGCGRQAADAPAKPAEATPASVTAPPTMAPVSGTTIAPLSGTTMAPLSGNGTGMVKAIERAAGQVTLEHGPIPGAKWPAVTMDFKVQPALLEKIAVGDTVSFGMKTAGATAEITSIDKK